MENPIKIDLCQTPVLGLGIGVDFTFTWDNKNKNKNNHNDNNNPHQNLPEGSVLQTRNLALRLYS